MYIFSADDEDDNLSVDNSIRKDGPGHGLVTKQDDDVGDMVTKQDVASYTSQEIMIVKVRSK